MKSIDRLAMELAGKTKAAAINHLDRFGFSGSECYEITGQFATGETARLSAPWSHIADAIKSTMRCSVRIGLRHDMRIDGLPQAYSHHDDQAMSKDGLTELVSRHRQRKNALGWADCKKAIRCIWPRQRPTGLLANCYFHCAFEAGHSHYLKGDN